MAPGANIHYYGAASCYDADFLDTLAQVVDGRQRPARHELVGRPRGERRRPTAIAAYEQVFLQGAIEGISFLFSSGDNGDELANTGIKQADYPTSDPYVTSVGGTSDRDRRRRQDRVPDRLGHREVLAVRRRQDAGRRSATCTAPAAARRRCSTGRPTRTASPPARARAGARTSAMDADPNTGMLVGETQTFPDGRHYDEYRIGGTSLASPLFAGMTALALQHAGQAGVGLLNPIDLRAARPAFTDVKGNPPSAGDVRVDYANGAGPDGRAALLGPHVRPGQQPEDHQGLRPVDGPRHAEPEVAHRAAADRQLHGRPLCGARLDGRAARGPILCPGRTARYGCAVNLLAVWLGKLTLLALRLIGRRGNALPGLVVEKVFPGYLARAMAALPEGVVVVTGTNGKTTTTKMVATVLGRAATGCSPTTPARNFVRGAITATVEHATLDRAAAATTSRCSSSTRPGRCGSSRSSPPRHCLLLNVMRDQLDRFGEIDTTAAAARQGRRGHDRARRAQPRRPADRGAGRRDRGRRSPTTASRRSCASCSRTTRSSTAARSHVSTLPAAVELQALPGPAHPAMTLRIGGDATTTSSCAPRARTTRRTPAGAAALALTLRADAERPSLAGLRRGRARLRPRPDVRRRRPPRGAAAGEEPGRVPADAAHARHRRARPPSSIAINDDYADGRDVSWLWDVDFAALRGRCRRAARRPGTRAADMAVRLRYDDVEVDEIEPDLEKAVRAAVRARRARRAGRRVQHLHRDVGAARGPRMRIGRRTRQ